MGFAKIQGHLSSRIGCRVSFGAPQDVHQRGGKPGSGTIVDEVWADPDINSSAPHTVPCKYASECWGDYSFCGQLIKWNDNTHSIRLAYYRRRCGDDCWEYASQMTVNAEWQIIKPLLERTLAKKSWFQEPPLPCT